MNKYEVVEQLMQVETKEGGACLRDWMRGEVLQVFLQVLEAEVETLCGAMHRPDKDSDCYRAGSAPGSILNEGRKVEISKPRVRRKNGEDTEEVHLATYEHAREPGNLTDMFLRALCGGVSTREQKNVHPDARGNSRSNISRLWDREGDRLLEEFRSRNIQRDDWLILMLDGVCLTKDFWAVVALGVAEDGSKHMLDFEIGASENTEVVTNLCERLRDRGFEPKSGGRLFCVFDGGKALRKSAKKVWGNPVFQRCLVHKERNLRSYLSRRDWGKVAGYMKRIRKVQGKEEVRKVFAELRSFVASKNAQALKCLDEAGEDLIALHLLEVPNTLHKNLLSTNAIENSLRNFRGKTGRVTRWRKETNQAPRWVGMALTEVEKGFRRLSGYRDLPALAEALRWSKELPESSREVAA